MYQGELTIIPNHENEFRYEILARQIFSKLKTFILKLVFENIIFIQQPSKMTMD